LHAGKAPGASTGPDGAKAPHKLPIRTLVAANALEKQVGNCTHAAKKEFSASETQNIIKYLNDQFYQFR
jgi:hypothetical protein